MSGDPDFETFLGQAEVVEMERKPFAAPAGALWVVMSGSLDLFLAPIAEDAPPQARRFVLGLKPGESFLGVAAQEGRGVVAVATRGTKVARLELAACPAGPGLLFHLERWISIFQSAASRGVSPPGRIRRVGSTKLLKVPEGGCMTAGSEPVVWLPHEDGLLAWEGEAGTWCSESSFFPLSRSSWVACKKDGSLQPLCTTDWAQTETWQRDLENFQSVALKRLLDFQDQELQRHCQRLHDKAEGTRTELTRALHGLSSVLEADGADRLAMGDGPESLLGVFQSIGRALGVKVKDVEAHGLDFDTRVRGIARASYLQARIVRLRDQWWTGGGGPLLARLKDSGLPVSLISASSGRYSVHQPGRPTVLVDKQVAATLEPDAFAFYRTFPARALGLMDLLRFGMFGSAPDMVTTLLVLLAAAGLSTLIPLLTGVLFGTIIPQSQPGQLLPLVMALIISALATACFDVTRSLAMLRFQGRSMGEVEAAVWDRLIHLPISFYRGFSAGGLSNRAQALTSILQLLTGVTAGAVMGGIVSLANFALLFYLDPRLALTATALVLVAVAVTLLGGYRNLAYGRALNQLQNHLNGLVMQLLAGVGKLRAAGAEDRAFTLWAREFAEVRRFEVAQRKVSNGMSVFNAAYPLLATMAIYATVASLGQETVDTATFLAFNSAFGSFFGAFLSMSGSVLALVNAVPLFEQARPILQAIPESDPTKIPPGELTGAIEFSHVGFGYTADGPKVLQDVSFKISPGEYVAIVGPSGSGKSTIARLMLGLESPASGTVFYDGQDLALLDTQALRRRIGVVLQNVQILPGSILSAIVGNSTAGAEEAWEAARMAGLEAELKALPMGLQTYISEGGGSLSGGQKQRLTIARAIISKPKILILDEATSALDNESQAVVTQSLSQLSATRIVIAHRLSTIRDADRILVIQGGRVAQQGSFDELSQQPGPFHELVKHQLFA